MTLLLEKNELCYRVMDDHVLILKRSDERSRKPETYNVRGLLSEQMDIQGLVKMIENNFDKKAVVADIVDEHKVVINALEKDHLLLGKFLASIAPQAKW